MKIAMSTRRMMAAIAFVAIGLWVAIALRRTLPIRPHLLPSTTIPGAFEYSRCRHWPFWSKFRRRLLGQPWPGDFTCPDHPGSRYVEDPRYIRSIDHRGDPRRID